MSPLTLDDYVDRLQLSSLSSQSGRGFLNNSFSITSYTNHRHPVQLLFPFMEEVNHQCYASYFKKECDKIKRHYLNEGITITDDEAGLLYADHVEHGEFSKLYMSEPHTQIVHNENYQ